MPLPAALPPIVPQPFAQNAPGGNINTPIPNTTGVSGLASYDQGFPTVTMQPVVAGGIPPEGQDFNGIFFAITAHLYYLQSGQRWPFEAAVATVIGGYPIGAIVAMADGTGEWINLLANNSANPDSFPPGTGAGASGWATLTSAGSASIPGLTGAGTVVLNAAQGKKKILVFSGTLVANQTVTLPNIAFEWILVNLCVGSFNLTANCGGGVGQTVPQGGYGSPLGVYSIGDGNLYPSVSPLGVPISVSAVANTLVERDGNAYVYATYFNQHTGNDNQSVAQVATGTGDGFLRWNDLTNFEAQLLLQNLGGAVTAGQVPVGAVTQYTPQILASAALTGTPTAPTAAAGTSTTQVATTAFVNRGSSLNTNGYEILPDGRIEQWGILNKTASTVGAAVAFSIPFPAAVFNIQLTTENTTGTVSGYSQDITQGSITLSGFAITGAAFGGGAPNPNVNVHWRAIGK